MRYWLMLRVELGGREGWTMCCEGTARYLASVLADELRERPWRAWRIELI
jgi:hypothetical protein